MDRIKITLWLHGRTRSQGILIKERPVVRAERINAREPAVHSSQKVPRHQEFYRQRLTYPAFNPIGIGLSDSGTCRNAFGFETRCLITSCEYPRNRFCGRRRSNSCPSFPCFRRAHRSEQICSRTVNVFQRRLFTCIVTPTQ